MSSGSRGSIPNNLRKTIQTIKEIAGNHGDDEIFAMLKECSMDPDETAQKLMLQDTFHLVKKRRYRRKENLDNKEPADSRWRPGTQGRGGRGARGNYSSNNLSHGANGGRIPTAGKENVVNYGMQKGLTASSCPAPQQTETNVTAPIPSSITVMENGPSDIAYGSSTQEHASHHPTGSLHPPEGNIAADTTKLGGASPSPFNVKKSIASGVDATKGQPMPSSDHITISMIPASVSGIASSASNPVQVPSLDPQLPVPGGTLKHDVGSKWTAVEPNAAIPYENKSTSASDFKNSMRGTVSSKSHGDERKDSSKSSRPPSSSSRSGSSASRPPSNYGSRSQQFIGPQRVGPSKEWKPKPANTNPAETSGTVGTLEVAPTTIEVSARSIPALSADVSEEVILNLKKKLDDLHVSNGQHVIIPNHLQVPKAERTGLSFGSFDAYFGLYMSSSANGPESDKTSTPLSESSQEIEEAAEEPSSSNWNTSPAVHDREDPDHPHSPMHTPEILSAGEAEVSSSVDPEYDQSKLDAALPPGTPEYPVHTAANYSFGFMPPMLSSQVSSFESAEIQARDVARLPSFVVQQPFNPSTSYYTQFYRPGAEGDGRFSPFLVPGSGTKYNGNIAMLSSQTGQSSQESVNSLVLSTAAPTPVVTQAAELMQSPISVNQQPFPVFRQPAGVQISHYPSNYIPYSQYFSPFYVPPPTIHHFLSNTVFPQQPAVANVYPPSAAAAATGVKYSLSQYKPGSNAGNLAHLAMPTGYGPYSSSPAGYSPSPTVTSGNSTGSEDLAAAQFKENNVYITGQQSEGSAVWIPASGREISGMQASSFYTLPSQGPHVTFAPTQAGHGTYGGTYHPAHTVATATVHPLLQQSQTMAAGAVEMVGPPPGVYQQPHRPQINWTNNY